MLKYELLTNNYSNINTNKYIILSIISKHHIYRLYNIVYAYGLLIYNILNSYYELTITSSEIIA